MKPGHGNQHDSRKATLWGCIHAAHDFLIAGNVPAARAFLNSYRAHYANAPASTRRRWKCGR